MSALTTHIVTSSEKKEKAKKQTKTQTSDQKLNKSQNNITLEGKILVP
jgi:hypothetical protein